MTRSVYFYFNIRCNLAQVINMNVAPNGLIYLLAKFHIFLRLLPISPELISFLCYWKKINHNPKIISYFLTGRTHDTRPASPLPQPMPGQATCRRRIPPIPASPPHRDRLSVPHPRFPQSPSPPLLRETACCRRSHPRHTETSQHRTHLLATTPFPCPHTSFKPLTHSYANLFAIRSVPPSCHAIDRRCGNITSSPGQSTFRQWHPNTLPPCPSLLSAPAARLPHSCTVPPHVLPLPPPRSLVRRRAQHPATTARTTNARTKSCPNHTVSEAYCPPRPTSNALGCYAVHVHWPPWRCPRRPHAPTATRTGQSCPNHLEPHAYLWLAFCPH
jgi:hypothetical protein